MLSLGMTFLYILLPYAVTLGPSSSGALQALVLVALGALVLSLVAPRILETLTRILTVAPNAPPARARLRTIRAFRIAGAPGTPGTVRVRAPSRLVRASA